MIFPKIAITVLCAVSACVAAEPSTGKDATLIYRAETPNTVWNGWGYASPLDPDLGKKPAPMPEQFDLTQNDGSTPRTFSGKVVGLESMGCVEVGLVSLVGIHWNNPAAYQWAPVAPDGSFSITDARYNEASKALVVRGPNTAWTFLRYDFPLGKAATNIVLRAGPSRKVRVTAGGTDDENLADVVYEAWPAVAAMDDEGHALRRQRLGPYNTTSDKSMDLVLPAGQVALFVKCAGWASYYQIIDTTKAENFHFVLRPAGKMEIRITDADGKPKTGLHVNWRNPAAPLSLGGANINKDGVLSIDSLVPGKFDVMVSGGTALNDVEVQEGCVTQVVLQDGQEAAISRTKVESSSVSKTTGVSPVSPKP